MNCWECIKDNVHVASLVGGVAATIIVQGIVKNPKFRETCVKTLAKGMTLQKDAENYVQNIKDEAQDLCYDAAVAAAASNEA